jgi:hypothetical protein
MWQDEANCKNMDTNLFFPELGGNYLPFVREVCGDCKVVEECLWYANELNADYGFFGGMSPEERRSWRKVNGVQLGDRRAA